MQIDAMNRKKHTQLRKYYRALVQSNKLIDVKLTIPVRLYIKDVQIVRDFGSLIKQYQRACSFVSRVYFDDKFSFSGEQQSSVYDDIKGLFGLTAQYAESVIRTVKAKYKAVSKQLHKMKRYKDKNTGRYIYYRKDLSFLQHPIKFHKPQAELVWKNNWSFRYITKNDKHVISISTLNKHRDKVVYYFPSFARKYLKMNHLLGGAHLMKSKNHHVLGISCHIFVKNYQLSGLLDGDDRGDVNTVTSYDNNGKAFRISGLKLRRMRSRFVGQRARLQSRQTRSANRKLQKISRREHSLATLWNHVVAKALVNKYPQGTLHLLEKLQGVQYEAFHAKRCHRRVRYSWPFYQLGQDIIYKAYLYYCKVRHVNPMNTSNRCPTCGRVCKAYRHHDKNYYYCDKCKIYFNDDFVGAFNINFLGVLQNLGYKHPFIKKDNRIGYHKKVHRLSKKTHKPLKSTKMAIKYISRKKALKLSYANQRIRRTFPRRLRNKSLSLPGSRSQAQIS